MPKRTQKLQKNKPYLGPPLPDDIIRMILVHATHSGATVRVVCKAWLRISNSLTPFFINRMNAMQIALTKQAAMRKADEDDKDHEEALIPLVSVPFVASRLKKRLTMQLMAPILLKYGVPASGFDPDTRMMAQALAHQLCYETDDEEYEY